MDKAEILEYLIANPESVELLKLAVKEEEANKKEKHYLGWSWDKVRAHTAKINKLIVAGIVNVNYDSHSSTYYLLENREDTNQALEDFNLLTVRAEKKEHAGIPSDLFGVIVGYEEEKNLFQDALHSTKPCNILLIGVPASAKSMFLLELDRLPNSHFALGGQTSRVGLADELFDHNPKYLIIDELDDMPLNQQSVLKSLMASGVVARRKHRIRQRETFKTWVFGSCNSTKKLSEAVKSRFLKIHFKRYTDKQFKEVVVSVLTKREGVTKNLAAYIAETVRVHTRDPREAIALSRIADTKHKVDQYTKLLWGNP